MDINRNYEVGWGQDFGSSPRPCDEDYRGPKNFSEPESCAVRDLLATYPLNTALSYHSYGDLYVMPFGTKRESSPDVFLCADDYYFYRNMSTVLPSGAKLGTPFETVDYLADGLFIDYAYGQGVKGLAVEIGPTDFHPPVQSIPSVLE